MKKFLLVLLFVLFFQYTENVNATVTAYFIQVAHNDEIFIINGEKFLLTIVEQQNNTQTKASKNGFKPSDDNPWKKFKIK